MRIPRIIHSLLDNGSRDLFELEGHKDDGSNLQGNKHV
jgi:hypothetical protein